MMIRFYENRFHKGLPALESLHEAQLWLLNEKVWEEVQEKEGERESVLVKISGKDRRTPPLYWAAFVLAGDWR